MITTNDEISNDYDIGWHRYLRMEPLDSCANDHQRRGWWNANRAQAAAQTFAAIPWRDVSVRVIENWVNA